MKMNERSVNSQVLKWRILNVINAVRSAKSKDELRKIYSFFVYRRWLTDKNVRLAEDEYYSYLADPSEIDPKKISPKFVIADTRKLRRLFRYLTYYWSFPVSEGVGRRVKILVFDEQNNKVIGLIGLKDPVIGLSARDRHIGWDAKTKNEYLIHVMDANVLGAVPPYNKLLGGKLVASLLRSEELKRIIDNKYAFRHGFGVVLFTTIAVYGKSVMLEGTDWVFAGYTKGHSTFHLDFNELRQALGIGNLGFGANYSMRLARMASKAFGFDVTNLGAKRAIYLLPLTSNYREVLNGKGKPLYDLNNPAAVIAERNKDEYIIPRSARIRLSRPPKVSELMKEYEVNMTDSFSYFQSTKI